jgi:hypothetical protein
MALDNDPLDCVRGRDRSDAGVFGQLGEQLRELVFEKSLAASRGIDPGQKWA